MNYTFSVSCLCVLYSLSLVSSERDLSTDGQTSNSPRQRASTPYQTKESFDADGVEITAIEEEDFSVLTSQKRPSITSENGRPAYPESPKNSPITLNTRLGHRRVLSHHESGLEGDVPSLPRHWRNRETPAPSPSSGGTIFGTLQEQRERGGLPITSSIEHSNAVQKDATTPTSHTFSQFPQSAISTFAGTVVLEGLTQRRNSGSPKNQQREHTQANAPATKLDLGTVTTSAGSHRYQFNEKLSENNLAAQTSRSLTTAQHDCVVPVDLEQKNGPDQHVLTVDINIRPRNRSCFEKFCCCLPSKTKRR